MCSQCEQYADEAEMKQEHAEHGRGTKEDGPNDPDCPCRGTAHEMACARAGCGFCSASQLDPDIITKRVTDKDGNIWERCDDPNCPDLEHPEDLHSHKVEESKEKQG